MNNDGWSGPGALATARLSFSGGSDADVLIVTDPSLSLVSLEAPVQGESTAAARAAVGGIASPGACPDEERAEKSVSRGSGYHPGGGASSWCCCCCLGREEEAPAGPPLWTDPPRLAVELRVSRDARPPPAAEARWRGEAARSPGDRTTPSTDGRASDRVAPCCDSPTSST